MGVYLFTFIPLIILVVDHSALTNAKPSNNSGNWVLVPNRFGLMHRVNMDDEMSQVQPFFLAEQDVSFELYTLKNQNTPQILSTENITTITSSNFNKKVPTRIYIHGWQERFGSMKKCLNDAYLSKAKKDVNLIAVNWEEASKTVNYIAARNRVGPIGIQVASLIDFMVTNKLANLDDISLIGFSLGAHIAGITGKNLQSGKLAKIVGLDPASPLFSLDKPHERIDRYDAKYVEIIHTNGAFLGFFDPVGTASFYPNGGLSQTGCRWDPTGTCSHLRAYKYFAESIYTTISFFGYPCSSFDSMKKGDCKGVGLRMGGEPGNYKSASNIYFLKTNSKAIYARGGSRDM